MFRRATNPVVAPDSASGAGFPPLTIRTEVGMRPSPSSFFPPVVSLLFLYLVSISMPAQAQPAAAQVSVEPRVTQTVDDVHLTTLRGNTHPRALAKFDRGAAPAAMALQRMLLVLKRS